MKCKTYEKQGICVVEVRGDMTGGPQSEIFHQCFVDQLQAGQLRFIVDVSRVRFIGSIGIGMIIGAFSSVVRKGGMLRLVAPRSSRNWNVLALVKLFRIIDAYETLEEALAAFASDAKFPMDETVEAHGEAGV